MGGMELRRSEDEGGSDVTVRISPALRRAFVHCLKNAASDEEAEAFRARIAEIDAECPEINLAERAGVSPYRFGI
jgi:hypothetical protein